MPGSAQVGLDGDDEYPGVAQGCGGCLLCDGDHFATVVPLVPVKGQVGGAGQLAGEQAGLDEFVAKEGDGDFLLSLRVRLPHLASQCRVARCQ